jgi:hypothetical protein
MNRTLGLTCFIAVCFSGPTGAEDKEILKRLEEKGAKIVTMRGKHAISVQDPGKWTEADCKALGGVPNVTSLSFGVGFSDHLLPSLAGLTDLEHFGTNGMQLTDQGAKAFAQFPGLKRLTLFHPGKAFTGSGLAPLADLKSFEDLTVAGSFSVNDEALTAIGKIKTLKGLRLWHIANTNEGVKRLKDLPALESLTLGQRLTNKPPACPDDQTVAILLEVKSLKNLTLMESRFGYESLAQLKRLPALERLTLTGVELSEDEGKRLMKEMPTVRITTTKPDEGAKKRIGQLFDGK